MWKCRKAKNIGIIVGAIFLIINLVWGLNYLSYSKYMMHSPDEPAFFEKRTSYASEDNDFYYTVKKPDYLSPNGNLASVSADGNISIIVWPSYFCNKIDSYGITLYDESAEQGYMFYVDEKMNFHPQNYGRLDPESSEAAESLLNRMKDQVFSQFQCMKSEFNF